MATVRANPGPGVYEDTTSFFDTPEAARAKGLFERYRVATYTLTDGPNSGSDVKYVQHEVFIGGSASGTAFTANQGTPAATASAWPVKVTDGTNTAAVKAASTAAVAADPAVVVSVSPNTGVRTQAGDTGNPFKEGIASVVGGQTGAGSQLVTRPGDWAVDHAPVVATLASASKAAGGVGVRHVCTTISVSWANDGTANTTAQSLTVTLRDGATGAGTVLKTWRVRITTTATDQNNFGHIELSGLNIPGTANTAMTVEFNGTAPDHEFFTASISGYDVS